MYLEQKAQIMSTALLQTDTQVTKFYSLLLSSYKGQRCFMKYYEGEGEGQASDLLSVSVHDYYCCYYYYYYY